MNSIINFVKEYKIWIIVIAIGLALFFGFKDAGKKKVTAPAKPAVTAPAKPAEQPKIAVPKVEAPKPAPAPAPAPAAPEKK